MTTPLRAARLEARYTALELAEAAATTENRLFQLERGRFRPRPDEARQLAVALNRDVQDLFPGGIQKRGGDEG